MCTVCSSGDVQTKFYLLSRFLNHVSCYSFNGWCDPFWQVLDIPYHLSIHNVLNVPPQEKIKWREISRWPGYWSAPSNPGIRESLIENVSHETTEMRRIKITLLTVSFLKVSVFKLWKHELLYRFQIPTIFYDDPVQQQLAHCYPLVSLQEPHIHGVYAWGMASPQYLCSVPVHWNVMCPLNVEISCNDISFSFNYMMVMYGTSAEPVCTGKLT